MTIDKNTGELILPRIKNNYNHHLYETKMESNSGISKTVPDQSMDVREILQCFTNGQSLNTYFGNLDYMEEDEIPTASGINIKKLDLSEQHALQDHFNSKVRSQATEPVQTTNNTTDDPHTKHEPVVVLDAQSNPS